MPIAAFIARSPAVAGFHTHATSVLPSEMLAHRGWCTATGAAWQASSACSRLSSGGADPVEMTIALQRMAERNAVFIQCQYVVRQFGLERRGVGA